MTSFMGNQNSMRMLYITSFLTEYLMYCSIVLPFFLQ
jgi:hypothetical protein